MNLPDFRAGELRHEMGIADAVGDDAFDYLADKLRMKVEQSALDFGAAEMVLDLPPRRITLLTRADLDRRQLRQVMAHGIGHVVLHKGNQIVCGSGTTSQQERQAELFAFHFLVARWWLPPWEIAERYDVTEEWAADCQALLNGAAVKPRV